MDIATFSHHEEQGRSQAGENGEKTGYNEVFHGTDYPVTAGKAKINARFMLVTVAAFIGIGITAKLGFWQLGRAHEKLAYETTLQVQASLPALEARDLPLIANGGLQNTESDRGLVHRTVALSGYWLPDFTVYLENRQMNGRPGFYVLTPLALDAQRSQVILVQRGWVQRDFEDRSRLPVIATPKDTLVQVTGRVALSPPRLYEFQGTAESMRVSHIRQNLDLAAFRQETGLSISDYMAVQTGAAEAALQRDWPVVSSGVEKHYGYAFQWFGLCGLISLLYVWFQIVRRFLSRP